MLTSLPVKAPLFKKEKKSFLKTALTRVQSSKIAPKDTSGKRLSFMHNNLIFVTCYIQDGYVPTPTQLSRCHCKIVSVQFRNTVWDPPCQI